jgi:glycosyltransferase involved in cell wall biosynthesis
MVRLAAFTPGRTTPSARFRIRQYIPALRQAGVECVEMGAPVDAYPPRSSWVRPLWGCLALTTSLPRVLRSWRYDVTLFQREMISTLVTLEPYTKRPRVLDVDDAIFLCRSGRTAARLGQLVDLVIAGNDFVAEWFTRSASRVEVVPTAVDADMYVPRPRPSSDPPTVGWIGTSGNHPYLVAIQDALRTALGAVEASRLRVVSDRRPRLDRLPPDRVDFVPWSERNEVSDIQTMDVGIMPLADSEWARGKCSFKMLQYMSCGLPVVVSPVGMNAQVLGMGDLGLAATGVGEWADALVHLLRDPGARARLGAEGRATVERSFSVKVVAPRLARAVLATAGHPTGG